MKNKIKKIGLLFAVMIMGILFAMSVSAESYDDFEYEITDGTVTITDYRKYADEPYSLEIPNEIEGYTVTAIGDSAFRNENKIKKVTIPETVKSIGIEAFAFCENLESVTIKEGTETIAEGAFYYCNALTEISLPDTLLSIGDSVFYDCSELINIEIGDNIQSIGSSVFNETAFYMNESNWDNDLLYIGKYLITGKSGEITGNINIKDGTLLVADRAFEYITTYDVECVTIPDSVIYLGEYCFSGLDAIRYEIGKNVRSIPGSCFHNYAESHIECVSIDEENPYFTTDSEGNIYSKNMEELILYFPFNGKYCHVAEGTKKISSDAFESFEIQAVILPESLEEIEKSTFPSWCELNFVYYSGNDEAFDNITIGESNSSLFDANIYYSVTDPYNMDFNSYVKFALTESGETAAIDEVCTLAKGDVTLPESFAEFTVDTINWSAFKKANKIEKITVPDSYVSVTFSECENLKEVYLGKNVRDINDQAFFGDYSMEKLGIDEENPDYSVDENGILFDKDKTKIVCYPLNIAITEYHIPDTVTSIGYFNFKGTQQLVNLYIPASTTEIDFGAAMVSAANPFASDILENIFVHTENPVFASADGVLFNKEMTLLHRYPDGKKDKEYIVPDGITEFGWASFANASNLERIILPRSIEHIDYSFINRNSPLEMHYMGTEEEWYNKSVFTYNPALIFSGYTLTFEVITEEETTTTEPIPDIPPETTSPTETTTQKESTTKAPSATTAPSTTKTPATVVPTTVTTEKEKPAVKASKPAKVKIKKPVSKKKKQITVAWNTAKNINGYQVAYSTSKKFVKKATKTKLIKNAKTAKITIKKLNSGKKYFIRVRAYKTVNGKKIYGTWSAVKAVKVK